MTTQQPKQAERTTKSAAGTSKKMSTYKVISIGSFGTPEVTTNAQGLTVTTVFVSKAMSGQRYAISARRTIDGVTKTFNPFALARKVDGKTLTVFKFIGRHAFQAHAKYTPLPECETAPQPRAPKAPAPAETVTA